ncbi:MAG: hypothetical protein LWY06_12820 [Firmicutes bacterium]|nr:hypothetical protein [Bacillota bacterium]
MSCQFSLKLVLKIRKIRFSNVIFSESAMIVFFAVRAVMAPQSSAAGRNPGKPRGLPLVINGKARWFILRIS